MANLAFSLKLFLIILIYAKYSCTKKVLETILVDIKTRKVRFLSLDRRVKNGIRWYFSHSKFLRFKERNL